VIDDLAYAVQLALGVAFAAAVVPKLRHPRTFADTVAAYELVPRRLVSPVAAVLVLDEAFLAVAFLTGLAVTAAVPLAAATVALFAIAVGVNLWRGREITCGCFGNREELISGRGLARLALLLAGCGILAGALGTGSAAVTVEKLADEGSSSLWYVLDTATVAAAAIVFSTWALTLPELVAVARRTFRRSRPPEEITEVA